MLKSQLCQGWNCIPGHVSLHMNVIIYVQRNVCVKAPCWLFIARHAHMPPMDLVALDAPKCSQAEPTAIVFSLRNGMGFKREIFFFFFP